jgi:hypothetical protein
MVSEERKRPVALGYLHALPLNAYVDEMREMVSRRRLSRLGEVDKTLRVSLASQMSYNPDRIKPSRPAPWLL